MKKDGKYVYKNEDCMRKMHDFYDRALGELQTVFEEKQIYTSYGKTHVIIVGDRSKPMICSIHGGNGISPLNIRIFRPLLKHYCIMSPDVIGMPGKSHPYRNLNTKKDDFAYWLCEVLDDLKIDRISFVVSSYSSAMLLALAKVFPERIDKAVFVVPSGFAHGPIIQIIRKMSLPFIRYYIKPSEKTMKGIVEVMISESEPLWEEFFDLMMSSYKMEMRPPKEYTKEELRNFNSKAVIFASNDDVFFPADRVFEKSDKILNNTPGKYYIDCKHLPSDDTMLDVCEKIHGFLEGE
ncbi:MAG: alpha/beta hydrolase [Lachnospiraceae bacterium]|nr:alpha/beta hydrolase [Lachnospiraceae bacterium]